MRMIGQEYGTNCAARRWIAEPEIVERDPTIAAQHRQRRKSAGLGAN